MWHLHRSSAGCRKPFEAPNGKGYLGDSEIAGSFAPRPGSPLCARSDSLKRLFARRLTACVVGTGLGLQVASRAWQRDIAACASSGGIGRLFRLLFFQHSRNGTITGRHIDKLLPASAPFP